jgi:hypothetical protein
MDLSMLLAHQAVIQQKLQNRTNDPGNIAHGWQPVHFAVSMLDAVIEEAIEAKRLIKARKWWTLAEKVYNNTFELYLSGSARKELLSELVDIHIQFVNVLYFLGVSSEEFQEALTKKLVVNDPDSQNSTIGERS